MSLLSDEEESLEDLDPAELMEQAAAAKEKGEDGTAAKLYNAAGNIYMSVAEYAEALDCFEKSLALYTAIKDETGTSDTMYNLGVAQINLEKWDEAVKTCETAMKMFEKLSNHEGVADAMYGLALAHLGKGSFEQAMDYFNKAQRAYKVVNNDQAVAIILMDIGNAYADKEDWDSAEVSFKKALKIYRDLDDKAGIADALSLLGDISETRGNQRKSAEYFVEAAQCYFEAEILDIAREVVERAEQKLWDVPKATRRRLRKIVDDIKDALPEETEEPEEEGGGEDFEEDTLDAEIEGHEFDDSDPDEEK